MQANGVMFVAFVLFSTSAFAGSSEGYGMGGNMPAVKGVIAEHNRTGERFQIKGECRSTCTMFLAIRNVCVEPSAQLMFHAGRIPEGTQQMLAHYNSRLRSYLIKNHYMESRSYHTISGQSIVKSFGYRSC
jgi:hypothetical protein